MLASDNLTTYDITTLGVAIAGFGLALASLGWQAATYVLSGSRVRAEVLLGATDGTTLVTYPPDKLTAATVAMHAQQGITNPVIAVEVRNIGRMAAQVQRVTAHLNTGVGLQPLNQPHAPFPHRLEAGSAERWWVDAHAVRSAAAASTPEASTLWGSVELGTGKVVKTQRINLSK